MYYLHTEPLLRLSGFLGGLCGLLPSSILPLPLPLPLHELLHLRWRIVRLSIVEEREGRIEEVRVLAAAIVAHVHADLVDLALGLIAAPVVRPAARAGLAICAATSLGQLRQPEGELLCAHEMSMK